MTPDELIKAFNKKTLDIPIYEAELHQGSVLISSGYARLYVDTSGKFVIQVYGTLLERANHERAKRRLVPRTRHFSFTGVWENRWKVEASAPDAAWQLITPTGANADFRLYPASVTFTAKVFKPDYTYTLPGQKPIRVNARRQKVPLSANQLANINPGSKTLILYSPIVPTIAVLYEFCRYHPVPFSVALPKIGSGP